jgi:hypothetical protein
MIGDVATLARNGWGSLARVSPALFEEGVSPALVEEGIVAGRGKSERSLCSERLAVGGAELNQSGRSSAHAG